MNTPLGMQFGTVRQHSGGLGAKGDIFRSAAGAREYKKYDRWDMLEQNEKKNYLSLSLSLFFSLSLYISYIYIYI